MWLCSLLLPIQGSRCCQWRGCRTHRQWFRSWQPRAGSYRRENISGKAVMSNEIMRTWRHCWLSRYYHRYHHLEQYKCDYRCLQKQLDVLKRQDLWDNSNSWIQYKLLTLGHEGESEERSNDLGKHGVGWNSQTIIKRVCNQGMTGWISLSERWREEEWRRKRSWELWIHTSKFG